MGTKCAICSTPYKDPSSIPCGHIFCFPCLQSHIAQTSQDGHDAKCPTCQAEFPFSSPDVNLVMKPLQKHLLPSIRHVHIDADTKENDQFALDLAEAKTALAKLREASQTRLAAKGAALEDPATQLEDQARKADDLQAKLIIEKKVTEKQKRELEGLRAQLQNQTQKADDLQAEHNSRKVPEPERRELLEALRAEQIKLRNPIDVPSSTLLRLGRPATGANAIASLAPGCSKLPPTTPKRPYALKFAPPAKRPRRDTG